MNSTIDDIKKLPDLFKRKEELEDQIKKLDEQKVALNDEIEAEKAKAKETLGTFDATIAAYKKASMEWWKQFYQENSVEIVQTSILSLITKQTKDQQELDESLKIVSDEFTLNVDIAKKAFEDNKTLQQEFAQSAGAIAQKAMCYDVCVFIDRSNFTIKKFNDNRDWGLHLCPNGINFSIFKYLFMLTNPFGYMDLKKAVMSLPSLYGKLLDSKKRLQEIIRQNNIKDVNNPVGELNRRLNSAKDTITRKSKELETTKQQVLDLQKLMALVGGGPEAFMQQWFGHQSFLSKQKERYVEDMRNSLSKLSDYSSMKLVYDELIENVFDFKDADTYVKAERGQIENTYNEVEYGLCNQIENINKAANVASAELSEIRDEIDWLINNYKGKLIEGTKADPASTFFYQADGWINEKKSIDGKERFLAIESIEKAVVNRGIYNQIPILKRLEISGRSKFIIDSFKWNENINDAVNLLVTPLRKIGGDIDGIINKRDEMAYQIATDNDSMKWALSNLITAILLSYPITKVHFTFIDYRTHGVFNKMLTQLDSGNLYTIVHNANELSKVIELYHSRTTKTVTVMEFVVWTDILNEDAVSTYRELSDIFENGLHYGYYSIVAPLESKNVTEESRNNAKQILNTYFQEVFAPAEDFNSGRTEFIKGLKNYVRSAIDNANSKSKIQEDLLNGSLLNRTPEHITKEDFELKVPIGWNEFSDHEEYWNFRSDKDLPHTFLLGGSGQGKSYFLHNILLNSMLKYRIEDLEFYLMDLKPGGNAFDRYKGMPHVGRLLINAADHQTIYEILLELKEKIVSRGELIKGYENIADYNQAHPDKRLPYIILVVDECQKLFELNAIDRRMQNEVNDAIKETVRLGRYQGVTFIFATQTFADIDMPESIKTEAKNRYLMRVTNNRDANELCEEGELHNQSLSQGYVWSASSNCLIHIYDVKDYIEPRQIESIREAIINKNVIKSVDGRGLFYSGIYNPCLPDIIGETHDKYPSIYLGQSVGLNHEDVKMPLMKKNRNLLITGANDRLQAERVFFNALFSLTRQTYAEGKHVHISLFDNPGDEDDNYDKRRHLFSILAYVDVNICRTEDEKISEISRLANIVRSNETINEMNVLFILAQEEMRDLLSEFVPQDLEIYDDDVEEEPIQIPSTPTEEQTVENELRLILRKGAEKYVQVVMQVDQPNNILNESDMIMRDTITQWFKNIVVLRSSDDARIHLTNFDIELNKLNDSSDSLRAFYLNSNKNPQMIMPYIMPNPQIELNI